MQQIAAKRIKARRVSHSLLDPWLTPAVPVVYRWLPIPSRFPPEGIILIGHLLAIAGSFGFALATHVWWGGLLIVAGVAGNHLADMVDGTHARATGQCRNGGELLDHFADPLSFSYWIVGLAVSCGRLDLGLAGVIVLYATAVLTNIKAKILGEFSLARFGPTEFKTILVLYGITMTVLLGTAASSHNTMAVALSFLALLIVVGIIQLVVNLVRAVLDVNRDGPVADDTDWKISG